MAKLESTSQAVLCVDPDKEVHRLLAELLRDHHPTFVNNAFEGVRELHSRAYDAFVLEQHLPDWSGVDLCRQIRRVDPHGPILFYTAAIRLKDRERALRVGASAYLCKPVNPQRLRAELSVLLELATLESLDARFEAERATQDELARYNAKALTRAGAASQKVTCSIERTARLQACRAFLKSGGTRANFERWWPSLFAAALAHYQLLENFPLFW
ncbi:MAG: response regulator transcription factor [Burkholderiales bacterium]